MVTDENAMPTEATGETQAPAATKRTRKVRPIYLCEVKDEGLGTEIRVHAIVTSKDDALKRARQSEGDHEFTLLRDIGTISVKRETKTKVKVS